MPRPTSTSEPCPTTDTLRRCAEGKLDSDDLEIVIDHIDECESCQNRVEELDSNPHPPLQQLKNRPIEPTDHTIFRLLSARRDPSHRKTISSPIPDRIGPYAVKRLIAVGGMGSIYEGRHVNLGRSVAIKWLNGERTLSRRRAQQVLREWRAHGRLMHPNIVTATDAGLIEGCPYLITELIDGLDLSRLIKKSGSLSIIEAVTITRDVAVAMDYAHQEGVAHLDIKPSNIMLDRGGVVKLLDLGTAQTVNPETESTESHRGANVIDDFGTLGFLAPERINASQDGVSLEIHDQFAADIYSLGCTLQYLLTTSAPFGNLPSTTGSTGRIVELIAGHRHQKPPRIELDATQGSDAQQQSVQLLIDSMLAKDPTARPRTMKDVSRALSEILDQDATPDGDLRADLSKLILSASEPNDWPEASGQTVGLTDLIRPAKRNRLSRLLVIGLFALALVLFSTTFQFLVNRSVRIRATSNVSSASVALIPRLSLPGNTSTELSSSNLNSTKDGSEFADNQNEPNKILPTVTRRSPYGYTVLGTEYHGFLKFEAETNTEFASQSERLLSRLQVSDPTIKLAAVSTVSPHDQILDMAWSHDGTRLAVLTIRNRIRVYNWDGKQFTLHYTMRGDGPSQWARAICWNPVDGSLIAASYNFVGLIRFGSNHRTTVDVQPVSFDGITSIRTVTDQGRVLILVATQNQLHCYDPEVRDVQDPFARIDVLNFDSVSDRPSCLLQTPAGIEHWIANFGLPQESQKQASTDVDLAENDTDDSAESPKWSWRLVGAHPIADSKSIIDLRYAADDEHYVMRTEKEFSFHLLNDGTRVACIPRGETISNHYQVMPASRDSKFTILQGFVNHLELRQAADYPLSGKFSAKTTRCPGDRLLFPRVAIHPAQDRLAVAWRGHAEVWNHRLETISRLPRCDAFIDATPSPLRSGFAMFRHDGSGIAIDGRGTFSSQPIPRAPPNEEHFRETNVARFCVPNGKLLQTSNSQRRYMLRDVSWIDQATDKEPTTKLNRKQTSFSISILPKPLFHELSKQLRDADPREETDWRYCCITRVDHDGRIENLFVRTTTGQPARLSVARDRPWFCESDGSGQIVVHEVSEAKSRVLFQHRVENIGNAPAVRISHDGSSIFLASSFDDGVEIRAIQSSTGNKIWQVKTSQLAGFSNLTIDSVGNIVVINANTWLKLDPTTGRVVTEIDPGQRYGLRHDGASQNPIDQGFVSWIRSAHIYPAAIWNADAELQAMVFATEPNSWVSISPDGEVLDSVQSDPVIDRFTSTDGNNYEPAVWASGFERTTYRPEQSLTFVCTHESDRCTFVPLAMFSSQNE
ncbi:serine/threonine protein kinase [Rubripirellula reticaptiva]|uniref:Serine/threonine-protein kinase PknH n=1 Tax=Rubripirellula reticaptiva TaxID=2528013 RepID=A0A5C6ET50_9BACT|nr:serine/threonine-protein kinase [Rubripirellula reticaptiva]TWU51855.1 Serine/threonine-protein kinase PknH [Rubripirellula reticaptiva]